LQKGWFEWYSVIDERIILGAVPLHSLGHYTELPEKLGVSFVISVVELHELEATNVVSGDDWKRADIHHTHVT